MGKYDGKYNDRVKYFKCEVCLKNIPIEYYFTTGDSITCEGCSSEYLLESKSPLELSRKSVDYSAYDFDDTY